MFLVPAVAGLLPAVAQNKDLPWVTMENGRLVYGADQEGNRIPDFSAAGYEAGEAPIPDVPVKMRIDAPPQGQDATPLIQKAIESMSSLPVDAHGLRGTLLLGPGIYRIEGTINLDVAGVVLRGSGTSLDKNGKDSTILAAAGLPRPILHIGGSGEWQEVRSRRPILDAVVPVGARTITVDAPKDFFAAGDRVIVQWNMTGEYIHRLGMDQIPPRRDGRKVVQWSTSMNLRFDRRIVALEQTAQGYKITLDVNLTQRMTKEDGPTIWKYEYPGRIAQVGVENLASDGAEFRKAPHYGKASAPNQGENSFFDSIFSEYEAVENAWMRNVRVENYDNVVLIHQHGRAITIENVEGDYIDAPDKQGKAAPFAYDMDGQQILMQQCNLTGYLNHVWTTQARVAGPNVYRDSWAKGNELDAGPHHRWATGTLWEQINFRGKYDDYNQWNLGTGHGWAGAFNVLWNSTVDEIQVESPPLAYNWVIGTRGKVDTPQLGATGAYYQSREVPVNPPSLYQEQLKERLAKGERYEAK